MLMQRIAELCKNFRWRREICPKCAGLYAPNNHGSMFRPVDPETIRYFEER